MKIGVLGGGQLGRMLALAGYPLGMTFRFLDPNPDAPAGQVGELIVGNYDDTAALARLAHGVDVVTFEFENVPAAALTELSRHAKVAPPAKALTIGQDRAGEKAMFAALGVPTPEHAVITSEADIAHAATRVAFPSVMKTCRLGYDGKGQVVLSPSDGAEGVLKAWKTLGSVPVLLERMVKLAREVSIIAVRAADRSMAFYPLVQNVHRRGILRTSRALSEREELFDEARLWATKILNHLDYTGVLAVEFFVEESTGRERLLANEIAPRVHNSGHWTQDGAVTSQFENHIRAVAGLPLGECRSKSPCAMVNLIGFIPDASHLLEIPGVHLHLYGKEPREGRKVGHVNITAPSDALLNERIQKVSQLADPAAENR